MTETELKQEIERLERKVEYLEACTRRQGATIARYQSAFEKVAKAHREITDAWAQGMPE